MNMFSIEKNNEKVGAYLKKLIEKKYPSHRQFCKAYLIAQGLDPNDEELRKMGNRVSQIIKGSKAIQTYDLPFFTELLGVSCEEILSCGKTYVPVSTHITNYDIAFSRDPEVWQHHIDREDKLILNTDEYNKTLIDYAIEFKNYGLLKYLMNHEYIWFVDNSKTDQHERAFGFGAGTSIKRREITDRDWGLFKEMSPVIGEEIRLRKGVISLALENEDFDALTTLHAKEVPALFLLSSYNNVDISCKDYYDDDLLELISGSSDKILRYFSEPYAMVDHWENRHTFIYPFIGDVIERLIKKNSKYAEPLLRIVIEYNQSVLDKLQSMVNEAAELAQARYAEWKYKPEKDVIVKEVLDYYRTVPEDGYMTYLMVRAKNDNPAYSANVIRTEASSDDMLIDSLIKQLNDIFERVMNITPTNIKED